MKPRPLMLGAVAYDPKVVTIWDGFQKYFAEHDLSFDYVLYTNYERQVEALFSGHIRRGLELAACVAPVGAHRSSGGPSRPRDLHARHGLGSYIDRDRACGGSGPDHRGLARSKSGCRAPLTRLKQR